MHLRLLGGASGVGATCQLLTIGDRRLLVDAGVRVDAIDRLPDLAALDEGPLDAILITHAHADHIGALPLVAARFPTTPIYASPATIRLMEVMLGDAVRVMARRAADELELPLYDDALVAQTLRLLRPLALGDQSLPSLPGMVVHAQRAGHIAGAVSLGFSTDVGRLVISGDVSVTPQRTILGAAIPAPRYPDLLILESTYGNRAHPNRTLEERRLAEAVATVIARGGRCLIPAFALGRAQEIISILRAAQRDGHIPPFPIAVDGLVRAVCAAYAAIPDALTPGLRKHLLAGGRPFFGGSVRPVNTPQERERILDGPPAAIVASSGMLTGGPSVWYAERLVGDSQSAILFSGYLDEEAPGRRLLDLAAVPAAERQITLQERTLPVACELGRYSLSAHADGDELAGIVRALRPKTVALVHGDPEARAALSIRLRDMTEVLLPQDGQTLDIAPTSRGRRVVQPNTSAVAAAPTQIGAGAPLDAAALERLWSTLRDGSGVQVMSIRELARVWYGEDLSATAEQELAVLLEAGSSYFVPLPGATGLYRLPAPAEVRRVQAAQGASAAPRGRGADQAGIQAIIDHYLGSAADLYQRSIDPATGAVTLRYFFPDVAVARDAAAHATIAQEAGVLVNVSPQPHQAQLTNAALACLPAGLTAERAPAIRLESKIVELRCVGQADQAQIAAAQAAFSQQTGWRLMLAGLPSSQATEQDGNTAGNSSADVFTPPSDAPRTEVNWAVRTARTWFGPETGCYKASADQVAGVLTLRFRFPDAARYRYAEHLAALAAYTGWTIQIAPEAHQEALISAAREALPAGLTPLGRASLQMAAREVVQRVQGSSPPEALAAAQTRFTNQTGWRLVLRGIEQASA